MTESLTLSLEKKKRKSSIERIWPISKGKNGLGRNTLFREWAFSESLEA